MTKAKKLFHHIASELPNATESKIFGAFCIKAPNGKAAVIFWKDAILLKLNKEDEKEILKLQDTRLATHLYAPERPMTGWVKVGFSHSDKWKIFCEKSIKYIANKKNKNDKQRNISILKRINEKQ